MCILIVARKMLYNRLLMIQMSQDTNCYFKDRGRLNVFTNLSSEKFILIICLSTQLNNCTNMLQDDAT